MVIGASSCFLQLMTLQYTQEQVCLEKTDGERGIKMVSQNRIKRWNFPPLMLIS